MTQDWNRIPQELRDTPQWCISAPDKAPYRVDGTMAKVDDFDTWGEFGVVAETAVRWGSAGVGFVLSASDQFCCIDLDVKDTTSPEELARYEKIVRAFGSYTERSRSGKGFHIWVKGKVGPGARREGVEIYSQERFIICTGNVYLDRPIVANDEMLQQLYAEIRAAQQDSGVELQEVDATEDDATVYKRALEASNGAKFAELWGGHWQGKREYPSQSEADLSLLSMLAFYSKSNEQVRRMFRTSGLGQREKAVKNDKYLNRTLGIIRGRQERETVNVERMMAQADVFIKSRVVTGGEGKGGPRFLVEPPKALEWPPGVIGEIAQWFYSVAPRPVREVAIVSALGLFAGLCGRAYQVMGSGLNLYIVLVARSAIGKEAMHSGISKLINHVGFGTAPAVLSYVDFADYASGPALVKALAERHSFVNVAGEFGRKLRRMAEDQDHGPMSGLRTTLTNLYQKSTVGTIVGGIGYSDKEKDVKSTDGVAYSMIGETTPDTFYEALTNTMMQDGFMSRFLIIEHVGFRPELNPNQNSPVPHWAGAYFANLTAGLAALGPGQYYDVPFDEESRTTLDTFNKYCDDQINSTDDETWRQMWNRAHLKSLKIAALLAVAENFVTPLITAKHAAWALEVVNRDIRVMSRKMHDGDVGNDDMARERKVLHTIASFLTGAVTQGYGIPDAMRTAGCVPRKYLQIRTSRVNSFLKDKRGHVGALDSTIRSLVENGYIMELPKDKIPAEWGSVGRCFKVIYLPDVYWK